jgi:hypothetical protein
MTLLLGVAAASGALAQGTPPLFKVGSSGIVGVGVDPDDASKGIAYSRLAVWGTDQNKAGPHLQFNTSADAFPLLHVLPWSHNNVSLNFDAYYDGAQWRSSLPAGGGGASYSLYKQANQLQFNFAPAAGQGNPIAWTTAMSIDSGGCVRAGGTQVGACGSDARLKTQVQPLPASLDAVSKLRLVEFEYRADAGRGLPTGRQTGVIAQEVQQVMPELVSADAQGMLRVDYSRLDRRIQEAVIEMARETQAQRAQIAALRDELAGLREQLRAGPAASR